jgi:uncharacterized NAD-dependent epimerase/dehydratase family protein
MRKLPSRRAQSAALQIWDHYSSVRAHFDKEAWVIGVASIIDQHFKRTPSWLEQALNEGEGVYRP